jgi:hypothetical protein
MAGRSLERGRISQKVRGEAECQLEGELYRELSQVVQKWERAIAALEEDERRQAVSEAAESVMLQAIQTVRIVVKKYEDGTSSEDD